jgi:hypothetical protein
MATHRPLLLYRPLELAFRTQYAEVKERCRAAGELLPGTPGLLTLREGTGYGYWYRRYYAVPKQEVEDLVCKADDEAALEDMRSRIEFSTWTQQQVRALRKLDFQVTDKDVARVLVELHNKGLFAGGLVLVGTLAFMAWLNELGAAAVSSRTQDIDLARRQALKLGAPLRFLETVQATKMKFSPVPGMPNNAPSTSVKRPGAESLRIDVLAPGKKLGQIVAVPELDWHAQTVPHYDYLLTEPREAAALAGGHCIPINLPAPERLVWHKLYSSTTRVNDPTKAQKDLVQAATLAAVLVEQDAGSLEESAGAVPAVMLAAARTRLKTLRERLAAHPEALSQLEAVLA